MQTGLSRDELIAAFDRWWTYFEEHKNAIPPTETEPPEPPTDADRLAGIEAAISQLAKTIKRQTIPATSTPEISIGDIRRRLSDMADDYSRIRHILAATEAELASVPNESDEAKMLRQRRAELAQRHSDIEATMMTLRNILPSDDPYAWKAFRVGQ